MKQALAMVGGMFEKLFYILKELFYMINRHKIYFLAPLFIILALLAFLIYYIGPTIIVSFIYAGV